MRKTIIVALLAVFAMALLMPAVLACEPLPVQCYNYETAYAKTNACNSQCFSNWGFSKWGWTTPIFEPGTYTWPLWAGAGQCELGKGIEVGSVTVVYADDGNVTVSYTIFWPYVLKETHVYAGTTPLPVVKGKYTVAPGQYYNASPFDGGPIWVIAHAVVGIPDPNFGS